jgi:arylsulfatase A-like enzyme
LRTVRPLLACAALLAACSPGGQAPLAVVARLGDAAAYPGAGPAPRELRLGSETRPALCPAAGQPIRLALAVPLRRLLLSVGREASGAVGTARYAVVETSGGGQRVLLEGSLPAGESRWRDHAIDLGGGSGPRRFELRSEGDGAPCWGGVTFLGPAPPALAAAPNVVLLSLDTLGASYLGSFGHGEGVSPRIDALLDASFSFRRAYAQYPGTLVSHTSLFTGLHPVHHGRYDRSFGLRGSMVDELARHGYLTAAFTEDANVGSAFGFAHGFDRWDDGEGRGFEAVSGNAATTFRNAASWLGEVGATARFFLFVHTYEVHSPYVPPAEDLAVADALTPEDHRTFPPKELSLAIMRHNEGVAPVSGRDVRRFAALYTAEVHHLDRVLGGFLDQLDALGLADDTLLVLTSDHGEQFGEQGKLGHGQTLHNRVLHVPLGFRWPGRVRSGSHDQPVELVDVMPTVFDLAGLPPPGGRDGHSLAALLRGQTASIEDRPAFSELQRDRGTCRTWPGPGRCWLGRYAVQTERFKYVSSQFPPWERLYDLTQDPDETRDVAAEHPEELARYRALVEAYRRGAGAEAPAADDSSLDALTRERLEALGYLD